MAGQAIGDLLAGAAGHPINRPALDAAVIQGQALAGLHTAQTEDALLNAQRMREEQDAGENLENTLLNAKDASGKSMFTPSQAKFTATQMRFLHGGAQPALQAWNEGQKINAFSTIADPNADPNARLANIQALSQKPESAFSNVGSQLVGNVGPTAATAPTITQTPGSEALQTMQTGAGNLHQAQANAGGFNPRTAGVAPGSPEDKAISRAVNEGRLDPTRLNSRNAQIYAGIEMRNPGQTNFNRLHADAALQANATFQQKAIAAEAIPTVLQNVTTLGKKLGYSDNRTVGKMQAFMNGEFNDPDYAEYMPARNDALMSIASVMRVVGMSDKAIQLEHEAGAPTMSPVALDGWLKGQMSALEPRLVQMRRVEHHGEPGVSNVMPQNPGGPGLAGQAPAGPEAPPATMLKEGQVTHFDNGQSWALRNGVPVQVK